MKIAIIGAGYCGLAVAWNCLQSLPDSEVVLYDPNGVGGGASGIAAGLLHPFSGTHAKLNRFGFDGMEATRQLLNVSSDAMGRSVINSVGVVRPAVNANQLNDFKICFSKYPESVSWLNEDEYENIYPFAKRAQALFIKDGLTIDCPLYIEGLWKCCETKGAKILRESIKSLGELNEYDYRIVTMGAATKNLKEAAHLSINRTKGQVLEIEWHKNLPKLQYPINSHAYILMHPQRKTCLVGSTFERQFVSSEPDIEVAKNEIFPKLREIIPELVDSPIVGCMSGLRASTGDHLPLIQSLSPKDWILTGMGSKGLLYHALWAKRLLEMIKATL